MSEGMYILIAVLIAAHAFCLGYVFGSRGQPLKKAAQSSPAVTLSEEELEKIRKEREDLKAEQDAFLKLMSYNADIAYGLNENPLEGS